MVDLLLCPIFLGFGIVIGFLITYSKKESSGTPTGNIMPNTVSPRVPDATEICDAYFDMCINQYLKAKYENMESWTYESRHRDRMGYKFHTVNVFMGDGTCFHENIFNNEVFAGWPHRLSDEDRYRTKDLEKQRKAIVVEIIAIAQKKQEQRLPSFSYPLDSFARTQLEEIEKDLLEEGFESVLSKDGKSLIILLSLI